MAVGGGGGKRKADRTREFAFAPESDKSLHLQEMSQRAPGADIALLSEARAKAKS